LKKIIKYLFFFFLLFDPYTSCENIKFYDTIILQNLQSKGFLGLYILGNTLYFKEFYKINPNCKWRLQKTEYLNNQDNYIPNQYFEIGLMNLAPRISYLDPKYLFMNKFNKLALAKESKINKNPWSFEIIVKYNSIDPYLFVSDGDLVKIKCGHKELALSSETPTLLDEQFSNKIKNIESNRLWIIHKDSGQFDHQYWE